VSTDFVLALLLDQDVQVELGRSAVIFCTSFSALTCRVRTARAWRGLAVAAAVALLPARSISTPIQLVVDDHDLDVAVALDQRQPLLWRSVPP